MAKPGAASEPSMEEILASIRQIISDDSDRDDGAGDGESDDEPPVTEAAEAGEEILLEPAASAEPSAEAAAAIAEDNDDADGADEDADAEQDTDEAGEAVAAAIDTDDAETQEAQTVTNKAKQIEDQPESYGQNLLSRDSDEVVSGAFSALAHTILAQNARTLEDLVSEMLQPMLKEWLDENLPTLVERMVRQEIERVSGVRR